MKVILTAFNGTLRSEPMEWPDGSPRDIRLHMDLEFIPVHGIRENDPLPTSVRICRFIVTDLYEPLSNGESARIYRLIDFV